MGKYVLKRLLALIPTILIIVFVVCFIMELTPSDPGTLILGQNAQQRQLRQRMQSLVIMILSLSDILSTF